MEKKNNPQEAYAFLHLHAMDQFDSQNSPKAVCAKAEAMGAKGFATTQHGVTSVVEPMRKEAAAHGLKYVPGIEFYFNPDSEETPDDDAEETPSADRGGHEHLCVYGADDAGWRAIGKAVTDSQNARGYAVLTRDILRQYFAPHMEGHGHVIATSACIQGVCAVPLRANEATEKQIEKCRAHQERIGVTPDDPRIKNAETRLAGLDAEISENKAEKAAMKRTASMKFGMREKQIERLKKAGDPSAEVLEKELEADRESAAQAAVELENLTKKGKSLDVRRRAVAKELKELTEKAEKWTAEEEKIRELRKEIRAPEELRKKAAETAQWFRDLFGDTFFYMEVQYHGIPQEEAIYPVLAQIAREEGIPLVATNDIHIIEPTEEELLRRRILRSLRFGNKMEPLSVGDDQLYMKSDAELASWLRKILPDDVVDEAMSNIRVIFDRCNVEFRHESHYPAFPLEGEGCTAEEKLRQEAYAGIKWRFPDGFPDDRYAERLEYELGIICSMGYAHYHLVVKDYLEYGRELGAVPAERIDEAPYEIDELKEWKKENGWTVGFSIGPGRGSAVGSLVCYLIGITALDPIKYDLLFERFLNPERVSMPDIDSDFSNTIRQKVIEYVKYKYGEDAVCGIMTTNAQAPRGCIRIAAKYYGYEKTGDGRAFLPLADTIARLVPKDPGTSFASRDENGVSLFDSLRTQNEQNPDAVAILDWAKCIEGCFTAYGAHAAGIVISDGTPIKDVIPLRWNQKLHVYTTQMDMVSVEENGFLKMDFLGLRTLDIITECIRMIRETNGIEIDPLQIPLDDAEVFTEIFRKGRTNSVFQFESSGMKNMLQRFGPTCFDDLIILVAMFRPGPLQYLDGVIKVKHGEIPKFITKELRPILGNTYGAIVFQEQVMEIFQKLAGYTLGGADQVRRAMSKKKLKVLEAERPVFIHGIDEPDETLPDGTARKGRHIKGCVANGIREDAADELFDQMTEFARYAFNKSHAAAYALIGYYTAWLKLHYPAEFLAAAMDWADNDGIAPLMQEARDLEVPVSAPDINRSRSRFTVSNGEILFGLGAVKSVGASADEIIAERDRNGEYHSLMELFARVAVKKNAAESLARAGALDAFSPNRQAILAAIPQVQEISKKWKTAVLKKEKAERALEDISGLTEEETVLYQSENGYSGKKPKTSERFRAALERNYRTACDTLTDLDEIVRNFRPDENIPEDVEVRMKEEREYLGMFVTMHPLDFYEPGTDGVTLIENAGGEKNSGNETNGREMKTFYGVIQNLAIKTKRSSGENMAFFDLVDRSGTLKVCVFTQAFKTITGGGKPENGPIQDGNVVLVSGNVNEETVFSNGSPDEDKEEKTVLKLFAKSAKKAVKRQQDYRLTLRNYYLFHASGGEAAFRKKFEMKTGGHPFWIYDELTGRARKMAYRVSDAAVSYPDVDRQPYN